MSPRESEPGTAGPDNAWTVTPMTPEASDEWRVRRALAGIINLRVLQSGPSGGGAGSGLAVYRATGTLVMGPDEAYPLLEQRLAPLGYSPYLRRDDTEDVVMIAPRIVTTPPDSRRPRNLLILTAISLWITGIFYDGEPQYLRFGELVTTLPPRPDPAAWLPLLAAGADVLLSGIPYAACLLAILVAHEAGHWLAAKRVGIPAGYPYLIPLPLISLGTLGAFMRIFAPPRDRRALLTMAAAGPLAGLAVAIPVLLVGLLLSSVQPLPTSGVWMQEGNPVLYAISKFVVFGRWLPTDVDDVFINGIARAGWAGLFLTAFNLMPAGQLDGGHIAYAMLGRRARWLGWAVIAGLGLLTFKSETWIAPLVLLLLFGRVYATPMNDASRLRTGEVVFCIAMLVLFALLFTPEPMVIRGQ